MNPPGFQRKRTATFHGMLESDPTLNMNLSENSRYCLVFVCFLYNCFSIHAPYLKGDVVIGGLFVIHLENSEGQCTDLDLKGLGRAQAMIFAIEKINNDSTILPNVSLGYDIRDYCGNVSKAMRITNDLFRKSSTCNETGERSKPVVALIGPEESSTALAIAGLLQVFGISAVSGTTTSPELSSQTYNHFYRTMASDIFRVKAIADIIQNFNWTYVAAIGLDDSYGRNGVWYLVEEAARRNNVFCVAMTEFISRKEPFQSIRNIVARVKQHKNIRVIVLWIYGSYEKTLRDEIKIQNLTGKVWLLSEGQGTELNFFLDPGSLVLDGSIGLQPRNFSDAGFREYANDLSLDNKKNGSRAWWSENWTLRERNCSFNERSNASVDQEHVPCSRDLGELLYSSYVPYIIDAVYAVANAIQIFLQDSNCQQNHCNVKREDVQRFFPKVNFNGLTGKIAFDEHGDPGATVFDIINFQRVQESSLKQLKQVVVGKWEVDKQNVSRLSFQKKVLWKSTTRTSFTPRSECVEQCAAGTRKSITSPCCWECIPCLPGSVNLRNGSEICTRCPKETYSNERKTRCIDLPLVNIKYSSTGGAAIFAFAGGGIVITLLSFTFFCRCWNSPIVKASNRELSLVLLIGIFLLFGMVISNLFEPIHTICKTIYPLRYFTYNMCLSVLLVKILRISSAFEIPVVPWQIRLNNNRSQLGMLVILQTLLLAMILPWLLLDPPSRARFVFPEKHIFIECKGYSSIVGKTLFIVTCCSIFSQALMCAFCAFKIRKIPENFSETKRLAFAMYIFLLSFIVYHPVEFSIDGWYVTVVDCVTTLLTAYGLLCCIFLPKLYIMLFRPELNNLRTIRHEVSQYSLGSSSVHVNPLAVKPVTSNNHHLPKGKQ